MHEVCGEMSNQCYYSKRQRIRRVNTRFFLLPFFRKKDLEKMSFYGIIHNNRENSNKKNNVDVYTKFSIYVKIISMKKS